MAPWGASRQRILELLEAGILAVTSGSTKVDQDSQECYSRRHGPQDVKLPRHQWLLGCVEETFPSEDGHVRWVKVRVSCSDDDGKNQNVQFFEAPVHKLVILVEYDIDPQVHKLVILGV